MQHDCASCDRPTNDLLCRVCVSVLVTALRALAGDTYAGHRRPGLIADLMDTRFKRDNVATSTGASTPGVQPLPFNFAASELVDRARSVLTVFVHDVADHIGYVSSRRRRLAESAEWLASMPNQLANFPRAADMLIAIGDLTRDIRRTVDRAPDRIYLGVCGKLLPPNEDGKIGRCPADLYGNARSGAAHCHTCRGEHDAHDRWQELQARVRDSLATAAEIAGAAPAFDGRQLNVKTIRTWAERGVIVTYGHDAAGAAMHHVGEVFAVAANRPQRARRQLAKVA